MEYKGCIAAILLLGSLGTVQASVNFYYDQNCKSYAGTQTEKGNNAILPGIYGANSLKWTDRNHANSVCGNRGPAELLFCTDGSCSKKGVATLNTCYGSFYGAWAEYICPNEPQPPPPPPSTMTLPSTSTSTDATASVTQTSTYHAIGPTSTIYQATATATVIAGGNGSGHQFGSPNFSLPPDLDNSPSGQWVRAAAKAAWAAQEAKANSISERTVVKLPIVIRVTVRTEIYNGKGENITGKFSEGEPVTKGGNGKGAGGGGGEKCDPEEENKEGCQSIDD